ncbi:MAG: hypothetical protein LBC54_01860 [Bacteroidales bacterium OttesenSCG-928-I14]|jgi:carboxyl-terminal processing protease|nr:hypothetical protein [Bacteroidales bacterium OttesenSCG-928-I14]
MSLKKNQLLIGCNFTIVLIVVVIVGNFISKFCVSEKNFIRTFYKNKMKFILDGSSKKNSDAIAIKNVVGNSIIRVNEFDPYSFYISDDKLQRFDKNFECNFCGIGINYSFYMDTITIVNILRRANVFCSKLSPGDKIIFIGDSVFVDDGITKLRIVIPFKERIGTLLKLYTPQNYFARIENSYSKRRNISSFTVNFFCELCKGIGYIKICNKFTCCTYDEFMYAVRKLLLLGCKSFIIDLRMNKGGSFESAIKIANELLPANSTIVHIKKKSRILMKIFSDGNGILRNTQIVILIDGISASASEIIAGSIQDNDRGLIIGYHSFGKSLIQNQIKLSDGSVIGITIAQYYTPSYRNIQRKYKSIEIFDQNLVLTNITDKNKNYCNNSVNVNTSSIFRTLRGRIMNENRGIVPDVRALKNNLHFVSCCFSLERKNIFCYFAFKFFNANREILNQFVDYSSMLEYLKTQPILEEIIQFAFDNGMKEKFDLINYSSDQIIYTVYAYLLSFFGDDDMPVYLSGDFIIAQAIEAINHGYTYF